LLACLVIFFLAVSARWIWLYRHAQSLDIDEAGYFTIALGDYYGLQTDGWLGWLRAVEAPSIQAPLTTAFASLIFWLVGPHPVAGFAVPALAGAITIVATYFLARHTMPPSAALTAAALVASCPIIVNYSRSFHFAMPATAIMTLALLFLILSERLSRFGWTSLFGVCLGLLPLARTMTIAFLPGLLLAALIQAVVDKAGRARRLALLGWAILSAAVTASSWMLMNASYVFHYLFTFGYGKRAAELGSGIYTWTYTVPYLVSNLYVPHALLLSAGMIAAPFIIARYYRQYGRVVLTRAVASSPVFPLLVCIAQALGVLTSSQNKGSAFAAPIVPAMIILALWGLVRLSPRRGYQRILGTICAVVCFIGAVPLFDASWAAAKPFVLRLPWLGDSVVSDGRGTIQLYEMNAGIGESRDWMELSTRTAAILQRINVSNAPIAFGFRHYLYNVNTVRLQMLLARADTPPLVQVDPAASGDTAASYATWLLSGEAAGACLLLTLQDQAPSPSALSARATAMDWACRSGRGCRALVGGEIRPPVTKSVMEEAARQIGFVRVQGWQTPYGQPVDLWERHDPRWRCFAAK
jgi:4-amino-4-deoxy-L-arabinose transferase-like glycosyltransferase